MLMHALPLALCLSAATLLAQEPPAELLGRAWTEYGLQAFSNADGLFAQVAQSERASQKERWQARMGRAFITHYQMPGRDPQAAIPQYEALLQDVDELRPLQHIKHLNLSYNRLKVCTIEQSCSRSAL